MYKNHTVCRACGLGQPSIPTLKQSVAAGSVYDQGNSLIPVFDLGLQPLANDFCEPNAERAGYAPLKVMHCPRCTLAQLSVVVNPKTLYEHYLYVTSPSSTMSLHFDRLAGDIVSDLDTGGTPSNMVPSLVEIGSNDGRLLAHFRKMGFGNVCGIDPAANLADLARKQGVPTITGLLDARTATDARSTVGRVDVILARHVFCHVDNWLEFIAHCAAMCHQETLVCIEVPYLHDLLTNVEFDTVYHEHTSYLTIRAMAALLEFSQLRLHRIIRYSIHGGALLLMLRMRTSVKPPHASVDMFTQAEDITLAKWKAFEVEARKRIDELKSFVQHARQNGKRVAALGASAKSTVWINACGFTRKDIAWIADTTPQKLYTQSPGADIPITDEGAILRDLPDYVICFAWNYRTEILSKNTMAREKGVKIVFPVPQLEIV